MTYQMKNKNFAVFILTHGRPENIDTLKNLKRSGWNGPTYLIIDSHDKKGADYIRIYGENMVKIFDKDKYIESSDSAQNFGETRSILFARNAAWDIAEELRLDYFLELDDDYTSFIWRFHNALGYTPFIKNLGQVFDTFIDFYESTGTKAIAFSQGGDHIGGFNGRTILKRKCMNSFFLSPKRRFDWVGIQNDDVNTYTMHGMRGHLFFTFTSVQLTQKATQSQGAGLTDMYLRFGTYVKSFTTVIMQPSSVKVNVMTTSNGRLHHAIKWKNTVPMIINPKYKKI